MPMDRRKYPKDWPAISLRIRELAGNKCEECGIPNHVFGVRDKYGRFEEIEDEGYAESRSMEGEKVIRIVLTVAHMDHDPMNCRDKNLKALCQQCHLRYDAPLHRINASHTREEKKTHPGQLPIFEPKKVR